MEIIIHTKNGTHNPLYMDIIEKIQDGELRTWEIVNDTSGKPMFHHNVDAWKQKAVLKPYKDHAGLKLVPEAYPGKPAPDEATKGYIIGRFTEILMVHFKNLFTHLEVK